MAGISKLTASVHLSHFLTMSEHRSKIWEKVFESCRRDIQMSRCRSKRRKRRLCVFFMILSFAPAAGFEPATNALTAHCSTTELHRNEFYFIPCPLATIKIFAVRGALSISFLPLSYTGANNTILFNFQRNFQYIEYI